MKHLLLAFLLLLAGGADAAQAKFVGVVPIKAPQVASGSTVSVTVNGTGAPASLYRDNGTTVVANPMTADTYGVYQFVTAVGIYDILITRPDGTTTLLTKQTIGLDPSAVPWSTPGTIGSTTPNTGSFTMITLTSALAAIYGGTGQTSYTVGDIPYASTTTVLSKLADVATGNALISGGIGAAPSWGKVGLTTAVSGVLPVANGGTNSSTALSGSTIMVSDGTHVLQGSAGTTTTVLHGNASGLPTYGAASLTADVSGILPVANGGTGATLAATGGTGQYLKQASTGAVVTVGVIPSADIATALTTPGAIGGTTPAAITGTAVTGSSITDSGLTSGRIPHATTAGLLTDSADLTYAANAITVGDGTSSAAVTSNGAAGQTRGFTIKSAGVTRWQLVANTTAESGSNVGSDFVLKALDDAGAAIDNPIVITRASGGRMTIARPETISDATASTTTSSGALIVTGGAGIGGALNAASATFGAALPIASGGTAATTASAARTSLGVAIDSINGHIELPTAKTYELILSSEIAYTVNEIIIQTVSGTCTAALKINGTNITGASAISVSSTPTTATCTAANSISTTNALTLVLSSMSSALDVSFTVKLTK